ncbi:MAG TPA: beta-N-acetylhexosaminidase [Candidatus Saccharimonadales bacterium]|nr:beta-N-acetylhexosaminidase [Candidatus Saccharimonadales bacterium]
MSTMLTRVAGAAVYLAWIISASAEHRPLLPLPQQIAYGEGTLPLRAMSVRVEGTASPADDFAAAQLVARLPATLGKDGPAIVLRRTGDGADVPADNETAGPDSRESYSIEVTTSGAEIRAPSSAGLFYGVQTLLQMVEGEGGQTALPVVKVHDWPALAYRGFMMDFSHGQLLRVSEIKRQLDWLARFKANQYYFYSEMNIEWQGYELVNPDARYSREEIRQLIDYARQRHIDVVPCMELYGHMHDLFRVEKFAGLGLPRYGDEFDPRQPQALAVIDDLLDQTLRLFSSPWCHVGFDEPWALGKLGVTPGKDPYEGFVEVLRHVAEHAQQRGKRILFWADIENSASTLADHPKLMGQLPHGVIAAPWVYEAQTNYDRYVKPWADAGLPTMVTPAIWNWNEIFPDYHRSFININGLIAAGKRSKTLGVLNTGWTDAAQSLYRESLPGLAFGAAAGWQAEPLDTNRFFADYCAQIYPPAVAAEVAPALEQLSTVEEMFEDILHNTTQHGFWGDPLTPGHLARLETNQAALRQARLLAENAQERLSRAIQLAPSDPTLNSLMMAARLFDYLGMKSLYAVEWAGYFRDVKRDPELLSLLLGIEMNAQDHGMLADLLDAITGLREPYREAWLEESTPYRLGTALTRWDAEASFWLATSERLHQSLSARRKTDPLPTIDAMRLKR